MPTFYKVLTLGDLPPGQGKTVRVGNQTVAVFNVNGRIYATGNSCVHRGGPLGEGHLEGTTVTCPWHAWRFDVTTGESQVSPDAKVPTFPVKIEGEDILVGI
ncbi:MAG: Rieske 2Fe-2S domain-containing protein [Candidatus Omnitrophica bacterium]|nr:Rieske 2Fe-2S domain-containing protein [Candidatus Omnitrophota bacterium]